MRRKGERKRKWMQRWMRRRMTTRPECQAARHTQAESTFDVRSAAGSGRGDFPGLGRGSTVCPILNASTYRARNCGSYTSIRLVRSSRFDSTGHHSASAQASSSSVMPVSSHHNYLFPYPPTPSTLAHVSYRMHRSIPLCPFGDNERDPLRARDGRRVSCGACTYEATIQPNTSVSVVCVGGGRARVVSSRAYHLQ